MANQGLLIGGVAVAGLAAYFLTRQEEETTLEDTQTPSFTGVSGDGEADNRTQKLENTGEFLDECATPSTVDEDEATSCATPLWNANESVKIEHPLAATNSDYAKYYFTVTIQSDISSTMTESAFAGLPENQPIGDCTIGVTRSGGFQTTRRWTANQNPRFNGSLTKTIFITKANATNPASSVAPSWNECLAAFGGYMPGKIGALGDAIIFRKDSFVDVGRFRYNKVKSDGTSYPSSSNICLDMEGNQIPLYAQMEVDCGDGNGFKQVGNPVEVTSANILPAGQECYAPCYPATLPTSGLAFGCTLPTVSISYPTRIHVMCDSEKEDCSQRPTSSAGGMVQDEIWNLNPAITTPTTMQKGSWQTPSGAVWGILFDSVRTPKVYQNSSGQWYVRYSNGTIGDTFIDTILPGFKAAYTRQSVECECPSDTMLEGTKFTLLDKYSCPSGGVLSGIFGGSAEWKDTYCGGLKPDYGCTDPRAINYNENKVKDPTDNDVCNPKYCNYGFNQILPECQGGGGLGGFDDIGGGGLAPAPKDKEEGETDEPDESPPSGGTGGSTGGNTSGGGFGGGMGCMFGAESVLKRSVITNSSQSFLNW